MSFKAPKSQPIAMPAPLPPPVIEDTQARGRQDADALRRRQGRASTILGGTGLGSGNGAGGQAQPQIATKQLLGG